MAVARISLARASLQVNPAQGIGGMEQHMVPVTLLLHATEPEMVLDPEQVLVDQVPALVDGAVLLPR